MTRTARTRAKMLALKLSVALGGDGKSGVEPVAIKGTAGVRLLLDESRAEVLLRVLNEGHFSSDIFTGKHWEMYSKYGDGITPSGCTSDRLGINTDEFTFREVSRNNCRCMRLHK